MADETKQTGASAGTQQEQPEEAQEQPKPKPKPKPPEKEQGKNGTYYIVNPAGAIHSVSKEHARWRLHGAGWRLAEENEIRLYQDTRIQRSDAPLCKPWSPDPDAQLVSLPGE